MHIEVFKDSAMVEFVLNRGLLAGYTLKKDEILLMEVSEKGLRAVSSLKTKTQIRKLQWLKTDDENVEFTEEKVLFQSDTRGGFYVYVLQDGVLCPHHEFKGPVGDIMQFTYG